MENDSGPFPTRWVSLQHGSNCIIVTYHESYAMIDHLIPILFNGLNYSFPFDLSVTQTIGITSIWLPSLSMFLGSSLNRPKLPKMRFYHLFNALVSNLILPCVAIFPHQYKSITLDLLSLMLFIAWHSTQMVLLIS